MIIGRSGRGDDYSSSSGRLNAGPGRSFAGGRVGRSGFAWVHEGEAVLPAPDSEAEIELLRSDLGADIRITLPVIVHIVAGDDSSRTDVIVDETLRRLRHAVEAQNLT